MDINDINIAKKAIQQINNSDYKHVDEFNDWIQKYNGADNFIDKCCIGIIDNTTVCFRFPEKEQQGIVRRIAFDIK